jgi:hypothetical protein
MSGIYEVSPEMLEAITSAALESMKGDDSTGLPEFGGVEFDRALEGIQRQPQLAWPPDGSEGRRGQFVASAATPLKGISCVLAGAVWPAKGGSKVSQLFAFPGRCWIGLTMFAPLHRRPMQSSDCKHLVQRLLKPYRPMRRHLLLFLLGNRLHGRRLFYPALFLEAFPSLVGIGSLHAQQQEQLLKQSRTCSCKRRQRLRK